MKKDYLLTPGPSQVPPEVLLAMAGPIYHHRTPRFQKQLAEAIDGLKKVFKTKGDVCIFTSSGTGAMEAAVAGVVPEGRKALTFAGGKFGERWGEIAKAHGIPCKEIEVEWGKAVDPKVVERELAADGAIAAVYVTQCETSTGVENDVAAIGNVVARTPALLVVDGISSVGACDMQMDAWGVDVLVTGSQKALMLPPGLAFAAVSPKARKVIDSVAPRSYYCDLRGALKKAGENDTPYTPGVSLVVGLCKALEIINGEGIDNVLARHAQLAEAARAAVRALGLEIYPERPANSVTAVKLPASVDGEKLTKKMRDELGVTIAGGQDELKGKVIRIAQMGYVGPFDVIVAISALEMALTEVGLKVPLGAGVRAAQEVILKHRAKK